jgi:phosphohistidine phosphatase SixA
MTRSRSRRPHAAIALAALLVAGLLAPHLARADQAEVVQALRAGGVAVFVRHSQTTPGVGDPPGWRMDDCSSQRNLDAQGRAQARRIGAWFRKQRITPTVVRNSPWCRARDTARLAFGRTQDWSALANLFENRAPEKRNVELVRGYLAGLRRREVAVLVSHGSSISAFVGESLGQGEAVVVRPARSPDGKLDIIVVGRIAVP